MHHISTSPINSHEMMLSKSNFTFHFSRKNALKLASQMENWPMFSDAWHHHQPRTSTAHSQFSRNLSPTFCITYIKWLYILN